MDAERARYANLLFGEIAIKLGFCTQQDIDEVVSLQLQASEIGRDFFFGDLLYKQGVLTKEQVEKILAEQKQANETLKKIRWSLLVIHVILVLWYVFGWVIKPI